MFRFLFAAVLLLHRASSPFLGLARPGSGMEVALRENAFASAVILKDEIKSSLSQTTEYGTDCTAKLLHANRHSCATLRDGLLIEGLLSHEAIPTHEARLTHRCIGRDVGSVQEHSDVHVEHVARLAANTPGCHDSYSSPSHATVGELVARIDDSEAIGSFAETIDRIGSTPSGEIVDAGSASEDIAAFPADRLPTSEYSELRLTSLPPEIHGLIIKELDDISRTSLKFTNSYFHASIKNRCARALGPRRRKDLIACLELDVLPHRALVQCPNCKDFRLREILRGQYLGRRWMLKRLSWSEERRSCCKTSVPSTSTALPMAQLGASAQELQSAECRLNIDDPGVALILTCLHCSAELPWQGHENVGTMSCPRCRCKACPLVFMPRNLSISSADT